MCWHAAYIPLLLTAIGVNYFAALQISKSENEKQRKIFLMVSITVTFGILFIFKYFNFADESFAAIFHYFDLPYNISDINILLPIGISFYSFHTVSYTIDVYRRKIPVEKQFHIFALFIAFFPQLVAGPIGRAGDLIHQYYNSYSFNKQRLYDGLKIMGWGFFKKIVIADNTGHFVNIIYSNSADYNGFTLALATVLFAFQVYCDFSGYSDIAVGSAMILGIELMENFKRPFHAKSFAELWSRWHISLTTWFRDYLYFPLGGNRVKLARYCFNLMLVFVVSGLWHGANWTFVVWGVLNGIYILAAALSSPLLAKARHYLQINTQNLFYKLFQVISTFFLFCFSLIFFRADTLDTAIYIINKIASDTHIYVNPVAVWQNVLVLLANSRFGSELAVSLIFILILEIVELIERKIVIWHKIATYPLYIRIGLYTLLLIVLIWFRYAGSSQFIYFQF